MDIKVRATLIRAEREKRAWTQEQLAQASGIGLRTVQRIEKSGIASAESVQALAAVFSLEIDQLRNGEVPGLRARWAPSSLGAFPLRICLALSSGVACAFLARGAWDDWSFDWWDWGVPGLLFAAGVLWPHLGVGRGLIRRAALLAGGSALSYWCAVWTALELPERLGLSDGWGNPPLAAFLAASAVGVGFVLVLARLVVPLRITRAYWLLGAITALLGGAAISLGLTVVDTMWAASAAFATWHVLMCVAIHWGSAPHSLGRLAAAFVASTRNALRQVAELRRVRAARARLPGWHARGG
jgi:transcriptional regulator with XRE-family HTH domain